MKIFGTDGKEIENPELEKGELSCEQVRVVHTWIVDVEEESHEEVVAEYPNGGKDVAIVIDVEEQGHWETRDHSGNIVDFDGSIPDDMPHENPVEDVWQFQRYRAYTEDELAEIAKRKEEAEAAAAKAAEREEFLEGAPERMDNAEIGMGELGVMAANGSASIEDLMVAVAELGALVAGE